MSKLIQATDQVIRTPVTLDGEDLPLNEVSEAKYTLFNRISLEVIFQKTLTANQISIDGNVFSTIINADDIDFSGKYYHEMFMKDADDKRTLVFKGDVVIESTQTSIS